MKNEFKIEILFNKVKQNEIQSIESHFISI